MLLQVVLLVYLLAAIGGILCLALAIYWTARGAFSNRQDRSVAFYKARIDLILSVLLLGLTYGSAAANARICWIDGAIELPGLKYKCADGEPRPHWSEFELENA